MGEIAKNNLGDNSNNMMIILKKIISNEKLILPRLKILVHEDGGIMLSGNTYDTLLFFNCVENT